MSFRNKLIVARSSLNNYDVTVNSSFWFCPFCSKKVKIGGNAMHYRRCSRRPLNFSSSSESSVSSCSDEVSSSDSSDKEIESVSAPTDPSHQQEEQVVPFDYDEDDEKMAESENEKEEEEVQEQKEDVQEDEELEEVKKKEDEVKKKKWPETFRQTSIVRRMSTVENGETERIKH